MQTALLDKPEPHHIASLKTALAVQGFAITPSIYSEDETAAIIQVITNAASANPSLKKNSDLFAIRRFFHEVPQAAPLLFNAALLQLITGLLGDDYAVVKAIYFDKPAGSNWFVAHHQDLTILVAARHELTGYGPWTVKQNAFAVQPPAPVLEGIVTLRIHLDDTTEQNGALYVLPGSQNAGVQRADAVDWPAATPIVCPVERGGAMLMKPLLFHASGRTTTNQQRRVVHLELSNQRLPQPLQWAEYFPVAATGFNPSIL